MNENHDELNIEDSNIVVELNLTVAPLFYEGNKSSMLAPSKTSPTDPKKNPKRTKLG